MIRALGKCRVGEVAGSREYAVQGVRCAATREKDDGETGNVSRKQRDSAASGSENGDTIGL